MWEVKTAKVKGVIWAPFLPEVNSTCSEKKHDRLMKISISRSSSYS